MDPCSRNCSDVVGGRDAVFLRHLGCQGQRTAFVLEAGDELDFLDRAVAFVVALPVTVLKLMAPELTGHLKPEQDTPMALPLS